jgi:Zn-dependent peptidase ImmA (M78 family)
VGEVIAFTERMARIEMASREDSGIAKRAASLLRETALQYAVPVPLDVLCDRLGIQVYRARFAIEELAGFIVGQDGSWTIYVNGAEPPERQRFTIAHELGHYTLHLQRTSQDHFAGFKDSRDAIDAAFRYGTSGNAQERQANQFAAALLMPKERVTAYWRTLSDVEAMARAFGH